MVCAQYILQSITKSNVPSLYLLRNIFSVYIYMDIYDYHILRQLVLCVGDVLEWVNVMFLLPVQGSVFDVLLDLLCYIIATTVHMVYYNMSTSCVR